jgi:hypothetical protein
MDSPVEGDGFELPVPRQIGNCFEASPETGPIEHRAVVSSEHLPARQSDRFAGHLALGHLEAGDAAAAYCL